VPSGLVISQNPQAGSRVEKGRKVGIVVSGGPASAPVPDVEGLSAAEAVAKLRKSGFKPRTTKETSSTVAAGKVISTNPTAGTEKQLGSPVAVIVSSGPAPVKVPDVIGQSLSAAEATLTNAGLSVGTVTKRTTSSQAPETVLAQSPTTGTSVKAESKVNLTVAQAPKEIAVPNVVGESQTLALVTLGQAGFKPKTTSVKTSEPSQVGIVLHQSPGAGSKAPKGSVVTIAVDVLGTETTPTTPTTSTTPPPTPPAAAGG
jgi:serine/threonine-protein kinase